MINESSPFPDNEIISFYDCTGMPIFYLHSDGESFYHYDGTPLAYLYNNEYIVLYSCQYLGWLYNGSIIDYKNGAYVFFTAYSSGGPSRPSRKSRPSRLSRKSKPAKLSRNSRPSRPSRQTRWSERSNMSFFSS